MATHVNITLGTQGDLPLKFRLRSSPIVELWLERMSKRHAWPMDHPDRFYNFNSVEQERHCARQQIESCIDTINQYQPIIERPFEFDQDCLNYMHSIFEQYHGLLDQQATPFFQQAPEPVRRALSVLNLAVHRCETIGTNPRFVCTWFGMPKTLQLSADLQQPFGTDQIRFGTMYLNYVEIGKTVEDLAHDNDQYIGDDAFQPFRHYSADFNVAFYDRDLTKLHPSIQAYIQSHSAFFLERGIESVYNVHARPVRFPVADLEFSCSRQTLLDQIRTRQWVHSIQIE